MSLWIRDVEVEACLARECPVKRSFLKESIRYLDLEKEYERVKRENSIFKTAISDLLSQISRLLLEPLNASMNFLRYKIASIQEILAVYYQIVPEGIVVWFFIPQEDIDAEMQIAEIESELLRLFQNLRFDLMVIPTNGNSVSELIPHNSKEVFVRRMDRLAER